MNPQQALETLAQISEPNHVHTSASGHAVIIALSVLEKLITPGDTEQPEA